MFEPHRRRPDPSEVFRAEEPTDETGRMEQTPKNGDGDELGEPETEWAGGNGEVFLVRPKIAADARNAPGASATAARGAISQSRDIPNNALKAPGRGV